MRASALLVALSFLILAPMARATEYWSLHVGVNAYYNLAAKYQLSGCENDAKAMRAMLLNHFGFTESHAKLLLSKDATAEGIIGTFKSHLIAQSRPGDVVVFTFSGHGSQISDLNGDETDGLDEFICPSDLAKGADSRPANLITDDQLRLLVEELEGRTFIAILDCCHSGTGFRDLAVGQARYIPVSEWDNTVSREVPQLFPETPRDTSGAMDSAQRSDAAYLFACKPDQLSRETLIDLKGRRQQHGIFTAKILVAVEELKARHWPISYRDLMGITHKPLVVDQGRQDPTYEMSAAMLDQPLFGVQKQLHLQSDTQPTHDSTAPTNGGEGSPGASTTAQVAGPAVEKIGVLIDEGAKYSNEWSASRQDYTALLEKTIYKQPHVTKPHDVSACDIVILHGQRRSSAQYTAVFLDASGTPQKEIVLDENSSSDQRPSAQNLNLILEELRRAYLVKALRNLRNPATEGDVTVSLVGERTRLRKGDVLRLRVTSKRDGYVHAYNVDCEGGIHELVPNNWQKQVYIKAGQSVLIPADDLQIEVDIPLGEEFVKVIVSDAPMRLPSLGDLSQGIRSLDPQEPAVAFIEAVDRQLNLQSGLTESTAGAVQSPTPPPEPGSSDVTIGSLAPNQFAEDFQIYTTYEN